MAAAVETRATRIGMRVASWLVLAFLYVPLGVIFLYAFNSSIGQAWPPAGLTTKWFSVVWHTPSVRTALVAGGLLAFALSFDEIVVTNFTAGPQTTLPIWIFNNFLRPNRRPQVNVVAMVLVIASFVPVYLAQRLTREATSGLTGR